MNPPILHIMHAGARKQIPFISFRDSSAVAQQKANRNQSYVASGEYGTIAIEQFQFLAGLLLNIRLNVNVEVELSFNTNREKISMIYGAMGYSLFRANHDRFELIAQTQVKTIYTQTGERYSLTVRQTAETEFSILMICIPVDSYANQNRPLVLDVKKYIEKSQSISEKNNVFASTIDFQKGITEVQKELRKDDRDLLLVQACIDLLLLETMHCLELQRISGNGHEYWDPEIKAVYTLAELIILGLDESWTIKKLASSQHLNPNKLKVLFKKHIGMATAAFRISVRMQKARQLLIETKLTVQEISAMVGYTNPAQFSSMFKGKMGCTPKQVRKERLFDQL
jgi:AraC-like DNA-binding protein